MGWARIGSATASPWAMRSRVWKCSSDQLRPANEAETLGAELTNEKGLEQILTNTKGHRATAVDVISEGPPPPEVGST